MGVDQGALEVFAKFPQYLPNFTPILSDIAFAEPDEIADTVLWLAGDVHAPSRQVISHSIKETPRSDDAVPAPLRATAPGQPDTPQSGRVLRTPDQLRGERVADGAARELLRGAGPRRCGSDHHRGTLDASFGSTVREDDCGLSARSDRGIPADHRRRSCTWFVDSRADQPQWGPGRWNLFAIAAVGAERRRRSVVPRGAQSCRRRGHRRDSRRVRPCCPQLRRRWLRRGGIAGVAVVHSARVSRPLDQRAHRSLRRGRGTSCTVPSRSARGTA